MRNGNESPINKTAALVVSKGYSYETKTIKSNCLFSETILKTIPTPKHPNLKDLTGDRFGRFKVIGLSADKAKRWVVRCSCGNYELRTSKCIISNQPDQMCIKCYSALQAIKKHDFKKHGVRKDFQDYARDRM